MTQITTSYKLYTFYKFVDIADPRKEVKEHFQFCNDIGIKGRIYIGEEGISATFTANLGQISAYKLFIAKNPYFHDIEAIDEKANHVEGHSFDRMIVKYRKEIVALGEVVTAEQVKNSYQTISPDEFKSMLEKGEGDLEILDMRNTYEYKLGHFKNAVPAGTTNFREMLEMVEKYKEKFSDKKVVMYCTGGIRCEKLSVLLSEHGFKNFYALHGGVVGYTNKFNDGSRLGNLYTFDGRVSTKIGDEQTHTTIGTCIYSDLSTDNCENCRYTDCNARIICRRKQYKRFGGFCSKECFEKAKETLLIKNVERDSIDYKAIRSDLKNHPEKFVAHQKNIAEHLNKLYGDLEYRHLTSQKEELVDAI